MQKIDVHGLSIRGHAHEKNHDHFAIATLNKSMRVHQTNLSIDDDSRVHGLSQGHLLLVADGVSDAPAPARASGSAVDSVVQYFLNEMPWYHLADGEPVDVTWALEDALRNSQEELLLDMAIPGKEGLRATMTLAFVFWPDLYLAHVGASRCYLNRGGSLSQLTTDHALVGSRWTRGDTPPPGDVREVHPQVRHVVLESGDVLALVTDGIDGERTRRELGALLDKPAERVCDRLVQGVGSDDRTAIVARFLPHEPQLAASEPSVPPTPLAARRDEPCPPRGEDTEMCETLRRARPFDGTACTA